VISCDRMRHGTGSAVGAVHCLSMAWVSVLESILHRICVAVFTVEEVVLCICGCGRGRDQSDQRVFGESVLGWGHAG
jgi:hypothetical protein